MSKITSTIALKNAITSLVGGYYVNRQLLKNNRHNYEGNILARILKDILSPI